jgi:hypothetical protein
MLLPLPCKQKPLLLHRHKQRPKRLNLHLKPLLLPELVRQRERGMLLETAAEGMEAVEMEAVEMAVEMVEVPQALPGLETVKKRAA